MFKVNNKNTRTTSLTFHIFSSVSIVEFEQVNIRWDAMNHIVKVNKIFEKASFWYVNNLFFVECFYVFSFYLPCFFCLFVFFVLFLFCFFVCLILEIIVKCRSKFNGG